MDEDHIDRSVARELVAIDDLQRVIDQVEGVGGRVVQVHGGRMALVELPVDTDIGRAGIEPLDVQRLSAVERRVADVWRAGTPARRPDGERRSWGADDSPLAGEGEDV